MVGALKTDHAQKYGNCRKLRPGKYDHIDCFCIYPSNCIKWRENWVENMVLTIRDWLESWKTVYRMGNAHYKLAWNRKWLNLRAQNNLEKVK